MHKNLPKTENKTEDSKWSYEKQKIIYWYLKDFHVWIFISTGTDKKFSKKTKLRNDLGEPEKKLPFNVLFYPYQLCISQGTMNESY